MPRGLDDCFVRLSDKLFHWDGASEHANAKWQVFINITTLFPLAVRDCLLLSRETPELSVCHVTVLYFFFPTGVKTKQE